METKKVSCTLHTLSSTVGAGVIRRIQTRFMSDNEFIEKHASGTLRKNKQLGFAWKSQYLHERAAYEFGWGFAVAPRSHIQYGDAFTEGDCKPITEAGWHIERYINLSIFPEDYFEAKYITYEDANLKKEGIGIIVRETSASFFPDGHIVFAIVAEFNVKTNQFEPAINPF